MINALYTLRKEYHDKKIYVWNINRNSLGVYAQITFGGIDIQGFVTTQDEYVGQMYLNHPIVSLRQIQSVEDYLILVADGVSQNIMHSLPADKTLYWSEASGINEKLRQSRIMVYGIGSGAKRLHDVLKNYIV